MLNQAYQALFESIFIFAALQEEWLWVLLPDAVSNAPVYNRKPLLLQYTAGTRWVKV